MVPFCLVNSIDMRHPVCSAMNMEQPNRVTVSHKSLDFSLFFLFLSLHGFAPVNPDLGDRDPDR